MVVIMAHKQHNVFGIAYHTQSCFCRSSIYLAHLFEVHTLEQKLKLGNSSSTWHIDLNF